MRKIRDKGIAKLAKAALRKKKGPIITVRNYNGTVIHGRYKSIEEALDAREGGETVYIGEREATEHEIFG
jgi:hypothetical protein